MATLNQRAHREMTTTHEGAPVPVLDALRELRRAASTALLWESTFYESGSDLAQRASGLVDRLVAAGRAADVAALAVEARSKQYLRHFPLFLVAELSRTLRYAHPERQLVRRTLAEVIQRPDELTEFLAIFWRGRQGRRVAGQAPLPMQVRRGLADALAKFDAYALAKYDRDGAYKLRDVLRLVHPKPADEAQRALWKQVKDRTLPTPDTWEVGLSAATTPEEKRAVWERLLAERALGGLALLRNLRNMAAAGVPDATVASALDASGFARVLPFRFVAALKYAPTLAEPLERAMVRALADAPTLAGQTILLVDVSGSMDARLSDKSELTRIEAAAALAMLLAARCERFVVATFSDRCVVLPSIRGFGLLPSINASQLHHGTWTGRALAELFACYPEHDRIVVLTDGQSHDTVPRPLAARSYMFNVAPYQNGVGETDGWRTINGWSERVVDYLVSCETDDGAGFAE